MMTIGMETQATPPTDSLSIKRLAHPAGWKLSLTPRALAQITGYRDGLAPYEASGAGLVTASTQPYSNGMPARKVQFLVDEVFLLSTPDKSSRATTEFTTADLAPVIADLVRTGHAQRIPDLRLWWHSHPFDLPNFSGQDIATSLERWAKEPWRLALLIHGEEKIGLRVRYVQWQPGAVIEWRKRRGCRLDTTDAALQSVYEQCKAQAAEIRLAVDRQAMQLVQVEHRMLWTPDTAVPRKRAPRITLNWATISHLVSFAFGADICHRERGRRCSIVSCPLNVFVGHEDGEGDCRCAFGLHAPRLDEALPLWRALLAQWEAWAEFVAE